MAEINEKEREILQQFRQRIFGLGLKLNDELSSDCNLVRWIRARDYDLNAAEKMLQASMKWRRENNMEQILLWDPTPEYKSQYPYHIGTTRDNGVFLIVAPGRTDLRATLVTEESRQYYLRYVYRMFEEIESKLTNRNNVRGVPVTQMTAIVDLYGIGFSSVFSLSLIQTSRDYAIHLDANMPERLEIAYFVNASKFFSIAVSFVRPVLSRKTLAKFKLADPDPLKWKQMLLDIISEEELPMLYGGKEANSLLNRFLT